MVNFLIEVDSVQKWSMLGHQAPDEVRSTFRFLSVLRTLNIITSATFWLVTDRNAVAKMVIKKLLA